MATSILGTHCVPANPVCLPTSRRGFLGGIGAGAIGVSASAFGATLPLEGNGNVRRWEEAMAEVRAADAELCSAFDALDDALDRWYAACRASEPDSLPTWPHVQRCEVLHSLSIDELRGLLEWPSMIRLSDAQRAGIISDLERYRAERAALHVSVGVAHAEDRDRETGKRWSQAADRLFATPAPNLSALADKIAFLGECEPDEERIASVAADARRLARGSAI